MNIKDAYKCYLEQHKLKDIEILSLEGRETLKKSEIYKIVACLQIPVKRDTHSTQTVQLLQFERYRILPLPLEYP